MISIGIDPAFRKTGFAAVIIDDQKEVQAYQFKGFLDFMRFVKSREWPKDLHITIENSNLQNTSFDLKGTKGVIARKGRNVGANQAASQYTVDFCKFHFGAEKVHEVSPKQKGKKWTAQQFKLIVSQNKHILLGKNWGQDKRDAYKLALMK